ncbi:MAG: hypothetical protein WCH21_05735 [Bacteroidota bacterium]
MKTKTSKVIAGCILLASFTMSSFGQTTVKTTEQCGKKPSKIEKSKVPTVVTETYFKEYPIISNEYWYGYPEFDYQNDWYGYNPYLFEYEHPGFYVVEFIKDKTPHKVIYSKSGKKIATHKKLDSELPKAVSDAIAKSEYSTWKMAKDKEEIFRDFEMDKLKVYKVEVEKGKEKHTLFYSSNGDLLKDKTVK